MKLLRHAHSLRTSALVAVLLGSLGFRSAQAQITSGPGGNYYPNTNSPIDTNNALKFIESQLNLEFRKVKDSTVGAQTIWKVLVPSLQVPDSQTTPTLPPVPADDAKNDYQSSAYHYVLASDAELDLALGAAIQKLLDGTSTSAPVPYTGTISDLVGALANYKKTTISKYVKTATTNLLNWSSSFPGGISQQQALEQLTTAACTAEPAQAAGVVGVMIPLVVPKVKGGLTGTITPTAALTYGAAQTSRTKAALTAAQVQSALNAIPGVMSKGGVRVLTNPDTTLRIEFGAGLVDNVSASSSATVLATALNDPSLGLDYYGQFTIVPDTGATTPPAYLGDFMITFKPKILNFAGGTNRDQIPSYADAAEDIVKKAMEQAAVNAVAITNAALAVTLAITDVSGDATHSPTSAGTLAKATLDKAKELSKNVAATAVQAAYNNGAGYLADEIAVAVGTKVKAAAYQHKASDPSNTKHPIILSSDVADAIFTGAPGAMTNLKEVALISAGLMKGFKGSIFEGSGAATQVSANKPEDNIVTQVETTLGYTGGSEEDNYLTNVKGGFVDAYTNATPTNAGNVAQGVLAALTGHNNYVAARLTGAAAWLPGVLTASWTDLSLVKHYFIREVLQFDYDQSGDDSIQDILEAATRGASTQAATLANSAALWVKGGVPGSSIPTFGPTEHPLGEIVKGPALGLKGQPLYNTLLQAVVTKTLAGVPLTKVAHTITNVDDDSLKPLLKTAVKQTLFDAAGQAEVKDLASYAITGAIAAGHDTATAGVILALTKAVKAGGFYRYYQPILEGAVNDTTGTLGNNEQWRTVLGVMAATAKISTTLEFDGTYDETIVPVTHPKPTANMQSLYALIPAYVQGTGVFTGSGLSGYAPGVNDTAITKGGALINNLQLYPKAIFNKAWDSFNDPAVSGDSTVTTAVLTAVGLTSATSSSLAAAIAIKVRPSDATSIQTEAIGLNPAQAANIKITAKVATHVVAGTADLFDYLDQTIYQNSKYLAEIVTAATVIAPNYAHIVAHAVGFRAPTSVAKVVPALFNYAHITSSDVNVPAPLAGNYDNPVDATAAISAAVTAGLLEAHTAYVTGNPAGVAPSSTFKPATEITNLKNAITALVKQVLTVSGNTPTNSPWLPGTNANLGSNLGDTDPGGGEGPNNFMQANGTTPTFDMSGYPTGGFTLTKQLGVAGVITAFVAQAIKPTDTRLDPIPGGTDHSVGLVGAVITAAVTAIKGDVAKSDYTKLFAITQAAAQAAKSVASGFDTNGQNDLKTAVLNAFLSLNILTPNTPNYVGFATISNIPAGKPNPYYQLDTKLANVISFGVQAAIANVPGAGAAGLVNYQVHSLTGLPVTDIFGL